MPIYKTTFVGGQGGAVGKWDIWPVSVSAASAYKTTNQATKSSLFRCAVTDSTNRVSTCGWKGGEPAQCAGRI
ncbi:unnamed protein product [Closterium sp. Naga37s-1]|nr:unnamed protein product [Closterium sp. Naga37s-1]